jgi:hypothetical protein
MPGFLKVLDYRNVVRTVTTLPNGIVVYRLDAECDGGHPEGGWQTIAIIQPITGWIMNFKIIGYFADYKTIDETAVELLKEMEYPL